MNVIAVLYTLYVLQLCRGTKCGESLDPLHVLDISNVDGSKATVDEGNENGITYKSFVPKANKDLKRVLDGEAVLWKASSEKEKCTVIHVHIGAEYGLAKLHIRIGLKSRFECFKKEGEGWQSIEEANFDDLLDGMKNGSKNAEDNVEGKADESTQGELSSLPELPEENAAEEDDYSTGDLHDEIVSPEEDNGESQDSILECTEEGVEGVILEVMNALKYRLTPELSTEPVLQSPTNSSEVLADEPVNKEKAPMDSSNSVEHTLDISSPDPSRISSISNTSGDMESKVFYPKDNVSIVCIMDSGMPILAEAGTICTEAYLFSRLEYPSLVNLYTIAEGNQACVSFEKVGGEWKKITSEEFERKLDAMRISSTAVEQPEPPKQEDHGYLECVMEQTREVSEPQLGMSAIKVYKPVTPTEAPPEIHSTDISTEDVGESAPIIEEHPTETEDTELEPLEHTQHVDCKDSEEPLKEDSIVEETGDCQVADKTVEDVDPRPEEAVMDKPATPVETYSEATEYLPEPPITVQTAHIMEPIHLLPTPSMDIPSTVEPKVTYNALRNEIHSRVQEEPGEMMMAKPVKTKKKTLREESVPIVKTVDLAEGDSPSTIVYEVVEDGITHKSYFPKNHTFDNVMDGDKPVWTAGAGEESTLVFTYSKLGHPTILSVYVNGKSACFEKNGKEWSGITEAEFNAKHEAMKAKEDQEEILQEEDLSSESTAEEPKEEYVETHVVTVKYPKLENLVEKPTSEVAKEAMEHTAEPIQEPTVHYTAEVVEPLSPVTVDLSHLDPSKIDFSESSASGIAHKSYFPKGNNFFDKIQDGETEVWKAKNGEKCSMAYSSAGGDIMRITLKVDNDEMIHFKYLVKSDGVWKTVDQKEYDAKLKEMKGDSTELLPHHFIEPTFTFDINVADNALVYVSKNVSDNITHKNILPKAGLSFTKISDGDLPIWTACTGTVSSQLLFSSKGSSRLLTLQVQHDDKSVLKYFEKKDGMWSGITKDWFNEKLERMKFEDSMETIMDIENVDVNLVESSSGLQDGVSFFTYEPKNGVIITSIVDGDYTLWEASADEIWKHLYDYSNDGFKISTVVFSRNGVTKSECFERVKHGWKWIPEEEFANKRSLMRTGKALINASKFIQSLTQGEVSQAESPEQNSIVPYTLDLTTIPDDNKVALYERGHGNVIHKVYMVKDGASITEVIDEGVPMWRAKEGERSTHMQSFYFPKGKALHRVNVLSNDTITPRCFGKSDGGIVPLDHKTYVDLLEHNVATSGGLTVDVKTLTQDLCNYFMYIEGGLHNIYIFPSRSNIKSIFYGKKLWSSNTEECESAHIYTDNERHIAKITVRGKDRLDESRNVTNETTEFFEYQDNEWRPIEYKTFIDDLGEISRRSLENETFRDLVKSAIDIGSADVDVMLTYKYKFGDIYKVRNVPLPNKRVDKIIDGDQIIWEAGGNHERCLLSDVLSQGDFTLLFLHVKKGAHIGIVYFEKVDERWREIGRTKFDAKHEAMKKGKFKHSARELYKYLTSSDPISIDVLQENEILYNSFDYSFAGNAIKLIVPRKDISVAKLMAGMDIVWEAQPGEKLDHSKAYLNKDEKPELMHIMVRSSGTINESYMEFNNGNWEPCDDPTDKMRSLVTSTEWKSNFTIDLSTTRDGDNCTIFEVEILGVTTKHFFPYPGYHSIKVMDGKKVLWESKRKCSVLKKPLGPFDGYHDHCLSCLIYRKEGTELLVLIALESDSRVCRYFEKVKGEWKSLKNEDFCAKCIQFGLGKTRKMKIERKEHPSITSSQKSSIMATSMVPQDTESINLDIFDSRYQVIDVDIDGAPARVYMVEPKESIKKITKGDEEVWNGMYTVSGNYENGEVQDSDKCKYCVAFLRNNEPNMMFVLVDGAYRTYIEIFKRDNGWIKQLFDLDDSFNELRVNSSKPLKFLLDISSTKDDAYEYKFTSYELGNVESRFYATNSGYTIGKTAEGDQQITVSNEGLTCYLCETHSKDNHKLMRIHAKKGYNILLDCFEKLDGKWIYITEQHFNSKLESMRELS